MKAVATEVALVDPLGTFQRAAGGMSLTSYLTFIQQPPTSAPPPASDRELRSGRTH